MYKKKYVRKDNRKEYFKKYNDSRKEKSHLNYTNNYKTYKCPNCNKWEIRKKNNYQKYCKKCRIIIREKWQNRNINKMVVCTC